MKRCILITTFLLINTILLFPQSGSDELKIQVTEIDSNLYLIPISSVNTLAFIGSEGILLVDPGYEQVGEVLKSELQKHGGNNIKYIINTHWHFDHVGGNKILGKGADIIAHENVRKLLSKDEMILGEIQKAHPEFVLPKITVTDNTKIHMNDDIIEIIPLIGGHSDGDIIIHFKKSNALHIGDIIFSDIFPFVDVDHGGNVERLAENIQWIIDSMHPDVRIIPGHGRILSIEDLKNYRNMIVETVIIVKNEIEQGSQLEEIKTADVLKDWKQWEGSFNSDDWIEMIYASLTK